MIDRYDDSRQRYDTYNCYANEEYFQVGCHVSGYVSAVPFYDKLVAVQECGGYFDQAEES